MPSDESTVTLDTSADSAVSEQQTNASVSGGTTYDDSKVVERLDGILERFDSVDDALKSLESRSAKADDATSSVVMLDSEQYEHISYSNSLQTFLVLVYLAVVSMILGVMFWRLFSTGWEF